MMKLYQERNYMEEIDFCLSKGGQKWLIDGLKVDIENGVDDDEEHLNFRRRAFGFN